MGDGLEPLAGGARYAAVEGVIPDIICAALAGAILPFVLLAWWCVRRRRLLPILVSENELECMHGPIIYHE